MPLGRHVTHHGHLRAALRPRAGLAATCLLLAGLAGSAGVAHLAAPASAGRSDRPAAGMPSPRGPAAGSGQRTEAQAPEPDPVRKGG